MSRRTRKRKKIKPKTRAAQPAWNLEIDPETRKGIIVIFLFALGALSVFSYFNLAGEAGRILDNALAILFGWDRLIFPLFLISVGILLYGKESRPQTQNQSGRKLEKYKNNLGKEQKKSFIPQGTAYLGIVLLVLGLNGLIHLIQYKEGDMLQAVKLGNGGGYVGLLLSYPLWQNLGFLSSLVALISLFFISILLVGNIPLKALLVVLSAPPKMLKGVFALAGTALKKISFRNLRNAQGNISFAKKEITVLPRLNRENKPDADSQKENSQYASNVPSLPEDIQLAGKKRKITIDLPLNLLRLENTKPSAGDIKARSHIIQKTLANFNIDVEMGEICIGPTITQYTLKPAEGIKLSRITALHNDLALALAAHPVRIEAPIPGRSLVGVEVPNKGAATVYLKEILSSREFRERKSDLTVALGKDVAGNPWFGDLGKMPHLLVAGATGSGKTVLLNSIIISLLYQNQPDKLKFILIDPKRVEMPVYNGIPHLLTPVITDVKKTLNALKWTIAEMDRRFDLLSLRHKRDIHAYNLCFPAEPLPYLVCVIDELADLMVAAGAEMEVCIIRLAQMARAVGIHLIVATQRPSVDIITGLIKANITSRIAFAVASATDSRTILDTGGAEKLLGRGDLLYISPELSKPKRLQGALVSEEETKNIAEYLKEQEDIDYCADITETAPPVSVLGLKQTLTDEDPLLDDAVETIMQRGKASASLLQRRLKIGYARAARLLDILEEQGIIGPSDGAKPREILLRQNKDDNINLEPKEEDNSEEEEEEFE